MERATLKHQRRLMGAAQRQHLTQHDFVIPTRIAGHRPTFDVGNRACDQWQSVYACHDRDAGKLVIRWAGELQSAVLLIGGKHINSEKIMATEFGQAWSLERKAPQNQRRINRDGIERAGGYAEPKTISMAKGHYGDARGKGAHHVAIPCRLARVQVSCVAVVQMRIRNIHVSPAVLRSCTEIGLVIHHEKQ